MIISEAARKARKQMQEARLTAKADGDGYSQFYADQPLQKAKAKANEQIVAARKALRSARETMEVAQATGIAIEAAEAAVAEAAAAVKAAEAAKDARFKPAGTNLSGGSQ